MRAWSPAVVALVGVVATFAAATGCTTATDGTPVADDARSPAQRTTSVQAAPPAPAEPAAPTGEPVGTAIMMVTGGSAPVTIRYQINGGPEQTETDVSLPWEMQYPVFDELESYVAADGGDAALTCSIIMDPDLLVSFTSEPRPVCNFAYYG